MTLMVAIIALAASASAPTGIIEDFESLAGWQTKCKEISVSLDRAHVRSGKASLHLRMKVDHKNGDTKYPMGWPAATKIYPDPIDLTGWDFLEFDVYFSSSLKRDPDFAMHVTLRDETGRTIYRTTLVDLRQGRWSHERFCIRGIRKPRVGELHLWFSEATYDDGEVVDVYVDALRVTKAPPRPKLPDFGLGPTRAVLAETPQCLVWLAEPTEKVLRNSPVPDQRAEAIEISAARNEYATAQIVLRPSAGGGGQARLRVSDLVGPGGAKIPADNVWWSPVVYVPAREGPAEGYPDALPGPEPLVADRAWNWPVWIDVRVPEDARPGFYRGQIEVRCGAAKVAVPVKLRVFDFAVPKRPSVGFITHIYGPYGWSNEIKKWFGDMDYPTFVRQWRPKMVEMLARFRISPVTLTHLAMRWNPDARRVEITNSETYLASVRRFLSAGCNMFGTGVPYFFDRPGFLDAKKGTAEYLQRITAAYRTAAEFIEKNRLPARFFVYCADEVVVHKHTRKPPVDFDLLNRVYDAIGAASPRMKIFATEVPSPLLRTATPIVWCMNVSVMNENVLRWEQAKGREIWWYNGYRAPRPRADIVAPGIAHRATFWIMHKYGIDGYFIWTVNRWVTDPWKQPNRDKRNPAGSHFWLYPTRDGRVCPSLRLVMFRDGAEDYEYLATLSRLAEKLDERGDKAAAAECRRALEAAQSIVVAIDNAQGISYAELRRARELVARTIEAHSR